MARTMILPASIPQITARTVNGFLMGKPSNWPFYLPMKYVNGDVFIAFGNGWLKYRFVGVTYERIT